MLHSACIDGKPMEKQYSNFANHDFFMTSSYKLQFSYNKIAEKGTLFIFGQKTEKVVSIRPYGIFLIVFFEIFFPQIPFISLYLT